MAHINETRTDGTIKAEPPLLKLKNMNFDQWKRQVQHQKPIFSLTDRSLTMHEIIAKTGASRTTINRWIKAGTFPSGRKYSHNMRRWLESEIDAWILSKGK